MKLFAIAVAAVALVGCNESNRRDVTYDRVDRREIAVDQRRIEKSAEAEKDRIEADAKFEKARIEAEADASKKILEAEREKAAALNRAANQRENATDRIEEPAGAEIRVRTETDSGVRRDTIRVP